MAYAFKDKGVAEKLKKLVYPSDRTYHEKRQYTPPGSPQIRAYIAHPITDIPGAQRIKCEDSDHHVYYRILMGKGDVYIHERDIDGSAPAEYNKVRRYPLVSDPNQRVEPYIRTAWNICPETIIADGDGESLGCPDTMLFCVEDIKGDLYIVKVCTWDCYTSSSSSSQGSSSEESSSHESESNSESDEPSEEKSSGGSGFCRESADIPFISNISFSGGVIQWETGILHFRQGHFCGYETDGGEAGSNTGNANRIDLCNLECPSISSSSDGISQRSSNKSEGSTESPQQPSEPSEHSQQPSVSTEQTEYQSNGSYEEYASSF